MRRRFATRIDIVIAAGFAVLCLFYVWNAMKLRSGLMSDVVGPKTFPLLIGGFGLLVAIIFILREIVAAIAAAKRSVPADGPIVPMSSIRHPPLVMVLLLFGYVAVLEPIGYILATFLYVSLMLKSLGQKGWLGAIVFASCLTGLSYGLFKAVFDIRLPYGTLVSLLERL